MRASKRLGLAAAVVVGLIVSFAAPAGANRPVEVRSGTLTTVLGNFDLTPTTTPVPCERKPNTLRATTTANPNRWTLTGIFGGQFEFPAAGSNDWYRADFTILNGSGGAWAGVAPTQALTGAVGAQLRITRIGTFENPDCTKTNVRCIVTGAFTLAASSTYKSPGPGLPTTTVGDDITIDATSGPLVVSSCAPPFAAAGGSTASLTNLQAEVVV